MAEVRTQASSSSIGERKSQPEQGVAVQPPRSEAVHGASGRVVGCPGEEHGLASLQQGTNVETVWGNEILIRVSHSRVVLAHETRCNGISRIVLQAAAPIVSQSVASRLHGIKEIVPMVLCKLAEEGAFFQFHRKCLGLIGWNITQLAELTSNQ